MQNLPVTVIIPTYNRGHLIGRALESVLGQTSLCSEILVIDDGSEDDTEQLVRTFRERAGTAIRYLRQENAGPAVARNLGIAEAGHELLAFLDSDDHWHARKLELQYELMKENEDFLISHTRERWLRRGVHLNQKRKHLPRHGDIFTHCLQLCAVGMSTTMVRKTLFDEVGMFATEFRCCEDYDMWLRVSSRHPFLLVDLPLTVKEGGRDDQVSHQYRVGMDKLRISSILKLLKQESLDPEQRLAARKELVKKARIYGNGCLHHGKREEGAHYLDLAREVTSTLTGTREE